MVNYNFEKSFTFYFLPESSNLNTNFSYQLCCNHSHVLTKISNSELAVRIEKDILL